MEMDDGERKVALIQFCFEKRKLLTKLLVLVRLGNSIADINMCQRLNALIEGQDLLFSRVADDLFAVHGQMKVAKIANYDIPTAVDVLTTGKYQRLPRSIKYRFIAEDRLPDDEANKAIQKMEDLIASRLLHHEIIPPSFRSNMTINDGCVAFVSPGEFSVKLTYVPNQGQPWRIVDLKILTKASESHGAAQLDLDANQCEMLKSSLAQRLASPKSKWPILETYNHIHSFVLQLMLNILFTQAKFLMEGRWKGVISASMNKSVLTLDFWTSADATSNYQLKIHAPDNIENGLSDSMDSEEAKDSLLLQSFVSYVVKEGTNDSLCLKLLHMEGTNSEGTEEALESLFIDAGSLDLEDLLIRVTNELSLKKIQTIRSFITSSPSLWNEADTEIVHGTRSEKSMDIDGTFRATAISTGSSLVIRNAEVSSVAPSPPTNITVDPQTGRVVIRILDGVSDDRHGQLSTTRIEERINSDISQSKLAIQQLRYAALLMHVGQIATYLNFTITEFSRLGVDEKFELPKESSKLCLKMPETSDSFVVIGISSRLDWAELERVDLPVSDCTPEYRLWFVKLKNVDGARQGKPKRSCHITRLTPSDMFIMDASPATPGAQSENRLANAWTSINMHVLGQVHNLSAVISPFIAISDVLESQGIRYKYYIPVANRIFEPDQLYKANCSEFELLTLGLKWIISTRDLMRPSQSVKPIYSTMQAIRNDQQTDETMFDGNIFVSLDGREDGVNKLTAKMKLHDPFVPPVGNAISLSPFTNYDSKKRVISISMHVESESVAKVLEEFKRICGVLHLVAQANHHCKARDGVFEHGFDFPDLYHLEAKLDEDSFVRFSFEPHTENSVRKEKGDVFRFCGSYAIEMKYFSEASGVHELSVLADVCRKALTQFGSVGPLMKLIKCVSTLVVSLEKLRKRRLQVGQTNFTLVVLGLTNFRLVVQYLGKRFGFDFEMISGDLFMMFDGSMGGLASSVGLGPAIKGSGGKSHASADLSPIINLNHLKVNTSGQSGGGSQGITREGVLQIIADVVTSEETSHGGKPNEDYHADDVAAFLADEVTVKPTCTFLMLPHGFVANEALIDPIMRALEGYFNVLASLDAFVKYSSTMSKLTITPNEETPLLICDSSSIKFLLAGSANGRWRLLTAMKEMGINPSPINARFENELAMVPVERRNSTLFLKMYVEVMSLPKSLLEEMNNLCNPESDMLKKAEDISCKCEWTIVRPDDAPSYMQFGSDPQSTVGFMHEAQIGRIKFLLRFIHTKTGKVVLLGVRYNYKLGLINEWQSENEDWTAATSTDDPRMAGLAEAKAKLNTLAAEDRLYVTISSRVVPEALGGPGKIGVFVSSFITKLFQNRYNATYRQGY